jgi:hypothetical protein
LLTLEVPATERQELFDALGGAPSHVAASDRTFSRPENSPLGFVYEAERKGVATTAQQLE